MDTGFVTLTRQDPDFTAYLHGPVGPHLRAIPVETFNPYSRKERVTFRVVDLRSFPRPRWWRVYWKAGRPELLGLSLGPAAVLLISTWMSARTVSWYSALDAFFVLFFIHVAACLFNDYRDHMRGADRANRRRGSQVIQKGWATAKDVRMWAFVNGALAFVLALPLVWNRWELLVVGALAALGVSVFSWLPRTALKWGVGDLVIGLCFGPLLTLGFNDALAIGADRALWNPSVFLLGLAFGAMAVWTFQIRQLENLFRSGGENFRSFIGDFEFDRAQKVLLVESVILVVAQVGLAWLVSGGTWQGRGPTSLLFALTGALVAFPPLVLCVRRIMAAASPLSSDLVALSRRAVVSQLLVVLWWGLLLCL